MYILALRCDNQKFWCPVGISKIPLKNKVEKTAPSG